MVCATGQSSLQLTVCRVLGRIVLHFVNWNELLLMLLMQLLMITLVMGYLKCRLSTTWNYGIWRWQYVAQHLHEKSVQLICREKTLCACAKHFTCAKDVQHVQLNKHDCKCRFQKRKPLDSARPILNQTHSELPWWLHRPPAWLALF